MIVSTFITKRIEVNAQGTEKTKQEVDGVKISHSQGKIVVTEKGEEFWYRTSNGETMWSSRGTEDTFSEWKINNLPIFKTNEDCKRYWHFMDTVKEKSYEFSKEDWEDGEIDKFALHYNYKSKEFGVISMWHNKYLGEFFFKTEEDAQYIIDNFKKELMTYWL